MIDVINSKTTTPQPNRRPRFRAVLPALIVVSTICAGFALAQNTRLAMKASGSTGQVTREAELPARTAGIPYQSSGRRDPFLNPLLLAKKEKPADEELPRGVPPPGIAGTYVAQAVLQGTSIRGDGRVAIVRGADTRAYFLKEGDRLFDGYVKAIESDFITLVRETKMRSGKVLTQDVIKRLRTP